MAAVNFQHKNCLQSTLRKKNINTLFAGLGRPVLGKTVPEVLLFFFFCFFFIIKLHLVVSQGFAGTREHWQSIEGRKGT